MNIYAKCFAVLVGLSLMAPLARAESFLTNRCVDKSRDLAVDIYMGNPKDLLVIKRRGAKPETVSARTEDHAFQDTGRSWINGNIELSFMEYGLTYDKHQCPIVLTRFRQGAGPYTWLKCKDLTFISGCE